MVRFIIRRDDASMAAHVGGAVLTSFTTVDLIVPELEQLLRAGGSSESGFSHNQLVGCELLNFGAPNER